MGGQFMGVSDLHGSPLTAQSLALDLIYNCCFWVTQHSLGHLKQQQNPSSITTLVSPSPQNITLSCGEVRDRASLAKDAKESHHSDLVLSPETDRSTTHMSYAPWTVSV